MNVNLGQVGGVRKYVGSSVGNTYLPHRLIAEFQLVGLKMNRTTTLHGTFVACNKNADVKIYRDYVLRRSLLN